MPEVRRLMVIEGGAQASDGGRHHGEVAVATGNGADDRALPPFQFGQDLPAPDGLLAPLFHNLGTVEAGAGPRLV